MGTIELNPNRSAPTVTISLPCSSVEEKEVGKEGGGEGAEGEVSPTRSKEEGRENQSPSIKGRRWRDEMYILTSFPMEAVLEEAGADMVGGKEEKEGGGRRMWLGEKRRKKEREAKEVSDEVSTLCPPQEKGKPSTRKTQSRKY